MDNSQDFTRPVELACILDAGQAMRRMIPMLLLMGFAVWLLVALALGLMFPKSGAPAYVGGITAAALVSGTMYLKKRAELQRIYTEQQRLVLHSGGLSRRDDSTVTELPWSNIAGFDFGNSAMPAARTRTLTPNALSPATSRVIKGAHTVMAWGIVGQGTVWPLPNASLKKLRTHDALADGANLAGGEPHSSPRCVIFPGEFESDWTTGVIGDWLRHFRPDLELPQP